MVRFVAGLSGGNLVKWVRDVSQCVAMWRLIAFPFLVILTVSRWSIYQPWWYRADGCDNYQADFFLFIISPDIIRLIIFLIVISPYIIRPSPSILLPCLSFRDSSVSILILCRQVDSTVFAYYPISLIEGTKAILKYFWVFYAGNPHCHCFFCIKSKFVYCLSFFQEGTPADMLIFLTFLTRFSKINEKLQSWTYVQLAVAATAISKCAQTYCLDFDFYCMQNIKETEYSWLDFGAENSPNI